jgi:hypothetical protein
MKRQSDAALLCAILLLVGAAFFPVIEGSATFFLRDLGSTQFPASVVTERIGAAQNNPHASFGQPLRWNPNLLTLFPWPKGLYAANLQLLVHALLGFAGLFLFLRNVACDRAASLFGAASFSLSGFALSSMSFLNTTTVIGWLTISLWLADRSARRQTPHDFVAAVAASLLMWLGGEPVVALIGFATAVVVLTLIHRRWIVVAPLVTGAALSLPYWFAVLKASEGSHRLASGFARADAFGNSLHPLRLLESISPKLFGDWASIAGTWWGFAATGNQSPYLATTAIPLSVWFLAMIVRRVRGPARTIAIAAFSSLAISLLVLACRHLPIDTLPVRYPVKLHLATTILLCVAASMSAAELRRRNCFPSIRAIVIFGATMSLALLVIGGAGASLFDVFWDPQWQTPVGELKSAIARSQPTAWWSLCAAILSLLALRSRSERTAVVALFVPLLMTTMIFRDLVPTTIADSMRSPFLDHDVVTRLPVLERAGKDLDPVRRGLHGRYLKHDSRALAAVQSAQLWAISGAAHGVRYAFDRDPDGSYDDRMVRLTRHLDTLSWDRREPWLRQSGVGSVISYMQLPASYRPVAIAGDSGVPAALYEVRSPLAEVRRVPCAKSAGSFEQALGVFDQTILDDEIVVEAKDVFCGRSAGEVQILSSTPDALRVETRGPERGWLFVARSWNARAGATVNGRTVRVLPANGAFLAISLPAGTSVVAVKFR